MSRADPAPESGSIALVPAPAPAPLRALPPERDDAARPVDDDRCPTRGRENLSPLPALLPADANGLPPADGVREWRVSFLTVGGSAPIGIDPGCTVPAAPPAVAPLPAAKPGKWWLLRAIAEAERRPTGRCCWSAAPAGADPDNAAGVAANAAAAADADAAAMEGVTPAGRFPSTCCCCVCCTTGC
jgi:hypothetical protein